MNNQQSVAAIEQAMKDWAEALKRKDINAMLKDYAKQYRIYDVMETGESVGALKKMWEDCFDYFDEPTVHYKNLVIEATDDMGA